MKRKLFVIPLMIVLLITCMIPTFAAEPSVNGVAVTNGVGAPGQEVRMRVSVPSVMADYVGLKMEYDENLTLVNETKWLIDGPLSDVKLDQGAAVWASEKPKIIKGDIFELVFRINDDAELDADYNVACKLLLKRNNVVELEQTATATVTVKNLAKISGKVAFSGDAADPVTVELVDSENNVQDTQILEQGQTNYEFEVEQGVYTIRVKKTKHCPREYQVDMTQMVDKTQDAKILLYGDVTGDGRIQVKDAREILKYSVGNDSVIADTDTYLIKVADVTGDGRIQVKDAREILKYSVGNDSVFDNFE